MLDLDFIPNPQAWAAILAVIVPLLTAVIEQPQWSKSTRKAVAFTVSAVVGLATAWATGGLDGVTDVLTTVGIVIAASEGIYQKVWKPAGTTRALEGSTSPREYPKHRADV